MASNKCVVAAGFIIFRQFRKENQYLLLQCTFGKHWSPPKGHVDAGERELDTAFRETEEEAGLTSKHLRVIEGFEKVLHYEAFGKPKKVIYWLSELKDQSAQIKLSHEHTDYKWLSLPEACQYAGFQDLQETLREADSFVQNRLTQ